MALENQGGTPNPDGQSGAGAGQQSGQQSTGTGPTSGAGNSGGQPSGQATGAGSGQQAPRQFTYTEDRTDWTPRHRLNEESGKRTKAEQERDAAKAQLELTNKRLQIAMGLEPQDPKAAEAAEVEDVLRGMLKKMYPGIDVLQNLNQEQLNKVLRAAEVATSTSEQQMNQHTATVYESLETETARSLGVDKLTVKQTDQIRRAYVAEAEACMAAREQAAELGQPYDARNDFMARHLRRDPSLIKEFVSGYLNEWFTPAKRTVTAQQVRQGRRAVPNGGRSQDLTISNTPVGNLDNKEDFKKALLAARAAGG